MSESVDFQETGGKPDFEQFKETAKQEQEQKPKRRYKKRSEPETPSFDIHFAHTTNDFVLKLCAISTRRTIEPEADERASLDQAALVLLNKYAAWLSKYGAEGLYVAMLVSIVLRSPKLETLKRTEAENEKPKA